MYVVSAFRRTIHGPAKAGHYLHVENALGFDEREQIGIDLIFVR